MTRRDETPTRILATQETNLVLIPLQMTLVVQMSSRATMEDASKVDGFATETMTVATDPMRLNVHQQNVIQLSSSNVPKSIALRQNGAVMENSIVPTVPTRK